MISLLLTGQVGIGPGALFSPKVLHCSVMHRNTLLIVTGGGGEVWPVVGVVGVL